jgi:hypothetical protein
VLGLALTGLLWVLLRVVVIGRMFVFSACCYTVLLFVVGLSFRVAVIGRMFVSSLCCFGCTVVFCALFLLFRTCLGMRRLYCILFVRLEHFVLRAGSFF